MPGPARADRDPLRHAVRLRVADEHRGAANAQSHRHVDEHPDRDEDR